MKRSLLHFTWLCLAATLAQAQDATRLVVRDTVLANGLRVLVHPNPSVPAVSCRIFYATGSVHEHPGATGIAHMLEHMLFKGTRKVGTRDSTQDAVFLPKIDSLHALVKKARKASDTTTAKRLRQEMDTLNARHRQFFVKDELWQVLREKGGTGLNAFTTDVGTAYFVTLPPSEVELFYWLESDRMQHAVLRDFYAERDVVREERRLRYENRPDGRYWESLERMFWEANPLGNPTIGWPSDIENYDRALAQEHYKRYYGPQNAILVLAGAIQPDSAFALASRYFGQIPRSSEFPEIVTRDPEPAGQKRLLVTRDQAKPRLDILFQTPPILDSAAPAVEVLAGILSGQSGRLYATLVDSLRLCTDAQAAHYVQGLASVVRINAVPAPGADLGRIEAEIWKIVEGLKTAPVSPRELLRVKNQVVMGKIRQMRDMESLATELGFSAIYGDWKLVNTFPEAVQKVEASQVRAAATTYLAPERATVGTLVNKPKETR
jgi:predicted Zn-dependent peptidase